MADMNIPTYFVKIFFRIYPVFLACLLIGFLLLNFYLSSFKDYLTYTERSFWVREFWLTPKRIVDVLKEGILILRIPSDTTKRLLPQDWTLSAELICSSVVPIFLLLFKKGKSWIFLLFIFIIL